MELRKRFICVLFVLVVGVAMTRCSEKPETSPDGTLWVITELSASDGMNLQAEIIAERIEEANPGLTVVIDILPTDESVREVRLSQLRSQIMSGNGPDVYLLPSGNTLLLDQNARLYVDALFPDVKQAMYNGVFLDVAPYYDSDLFLETASLKKEVMAAGCIDAMRYVLPLRFNMPLVLYTTDNPAELSQDAINSGFLSLVDFTLNRTKEPLSAYSIQMPEDIGVFAEVFDYEKGELLLSQQEIERYMRLYQAWQASASGQYLLLKNEWAAQIRQGYISDVGEAMVQSDPVVQEDIARQISNISHQNFGSLTYFIWHGANWMDAGFPYYTTDLGAVMDSIALAKALNQKIVMNPLRTTEGTITAEVTYYGAVGSSCQQPDLAYEFLRYFLQEDFQWERYRPKLDKSQPIERWWDDDQEDGLIEKSFPVRISSSVAELWRNRQWQEKGEGTHGMCAVRDRMLQNDTMLLTDTDIPAIFWEVDTVHFPIGQALEDSMAYALSLLNDPTGNPTDADIHRLAQEVYQNLWWHLAEG